jgi:NAD(P)-dependent dehydrogenase (short-subunit alcohol dehydrogenase family)
LTGPVDGKRAIVTGGCGGIGLRVVDVLVHGGAKVAVLDPDARGIDRLRDANPDGDTVIAVCGDQTEPATVASVCDQVQQRWGGPANILANVGAVRAFRDFLDLDSEILERHYRVNAVGPMLCMTEFARRLIAAGAPGSIVNVTSTVLHRAVSSNAAYASSKAALLGLSRSAAVELAASGIRVNCVAPGVVHTPMTEEYLGDPQRRAEFEARVPLHRLGTGDDIAQAIVYFASDASSYVTGMTLSVDGGLTTKA